MYTVMVQPTLLETSTMGIGAVMTVVGAGAVGVGGAMVFLGLLQKLVLQQPGARSDWATDFVGGLSLVAMGFVVALQGSKYRGRGSSGHKAGYPKPTHGHTPTSGNGLSSGIDWGHILTVGLLIVAAMLLLATARIVWRHQKRRRAQAANAQRVGLDALGHGRKPQGEKAVRTIRLARSASSEHEQAKAWQTAANILAALHLAHLPDTAQAAVESGAQAAITTG